MTFQEGSFYFVTRLHESNIIKATRISALRVRQKFWHYNVYRALSTNLDAQPRGRMRKRRLKVMGRAHEILITERLFVAIEYEAIRNCS